MVSLMQKWATKTSLWDSDMNKIAIVIISDIDNKQFRHPERFLFKTCWLCFYKALVIPVCVVDF